MINIRDMLTRLNGAVNAQSEIINIQSGIIDDMFRLLMQHIGASEIPDIVDNISRAAALRGKIDN